MGTQLTLAARGNTILPNHNDGVRTIFKRILAERDVDVTLGAEVVGQEPASNSGTLFLFCLFVCHETIGLEKKQKKNMPFSKKEKTKRNTLTYPKGPLFLFAMDG